MESNAVYFYAVSELVAVGKSLAKNTPISENVRLNDKSPLWAKTKLLGQ